MRGASITAEAPLKFKTSILQAYIGRAPLALALERTVECRIFETLSFERPILDLGCGEGMFAEVLFAEPIDTGVDPDPGEIALARTTGAYLELLECYGAAIDKPDASYRTVFANSVLEHIPELRPVLREAYRLLAPGGRLYFTVPSRNFERYTTTNLLLETLGAEDLAARFRVFFNKFWAHYHCYSVEEWSETAREAGFEVTDAYSYNPRFNCLFNAALTPVAFPNKLIKNSTGRWFLFPGLRALSASFLSAICAPLLRGAEGARDGGLVFVALRKA